MLKKNNRKNSSVYNINYMACSTLISVPSIDTCFIHLVQPVIIPAEQISLFLGWKGGARNARPHVVVQ